MMRHACLFAMLVGLALSAPSALAQQGPVRKAGDVPGPIDSLQDLQELGRMTFMMVDANGDRQISQREAVDAGNLLVGGLFFDTDRNGDNVLTSEETRQVREDFLSQKPWLRYVIETVRSTSKANGRPASDAGQPATSATRAPLATLAATFDTNGDGQLQSTELRQAVQTSVQDLFATADTNRDNQLSQSEINAMAAGLARTVADAAFRGTDTDQSGQISQAEWEKALVGPSRVVFHVVDLNNDGQFSREEAQTARQVILSKLQGMALPEAPNSPRNTINSVLGSQTRPVQPMAAPSVPR